MREQQEQQPVLPEESKIASANFESWNDTLQTKDPEKVAALYSDDATFLPTVSGKFMKGKDGAAEYFEHFLKKDPSGRVIEEKIITLEPGCYLHSGKYNFQVGPADNRQVVEAEFSFVWMKDSNDDWKIIHHHSSMAPEKEDQREAWERLLQESSAQETAEEATQEISPSIALHSGVYNKIRFTLVERKSEEGGIEILHRHLSPRPEA
jgi:uncharacterized protein (TIGR02246 family)